MCRYVYLGAEGEREMGDSIEEGEIQLVQEYEGEDVELNFHIANMYNYEEEGAEEELPRVRREELIDEGEEREELSSLTGEGEERLSSQGSSEENLEEGRRMGMGMRIRTRMNNCRCM